MNQIIFKVINYGSREYQIAVALREKILRKTLGLSFTARELSREKKHIHVAGFKNKDIIATAVLVPEGKICKMQRVAVKKNYQRTGIGTQLNAFCEAYARAHGFRSIYCHARKSAIPFYQKNKYFIEGRFFNEDTLPHIKMRKHLFGNIIKSGAREQKVIVNNIVNFNRLKLGIPPNAPSTKVINFHIKNDGEVIGGINAFLYFKLSVLFINQLFVDAHYRDLGLGSSLLMKIENEAKKRGALLAHLETFDWQAKAFYLKHGYEIFGILEDCPSGHKRYYMKKKL